MKRIVAEIEKCLACRACELACALAHAGADDGGTEDLVSVIARGARPRLYIEAAERFAVPLQCRHCDDAPCVKVCPSGALTRPDEARPVAVCEDKCIGCGFCAQACPFGVIRLSAGRRAVIKCDLCVGRQAKGLGPACVDACPVRALSFEEEEDLARRKRARAAAASVAELTEATADERG